VKGNEVTSLPRYLVSALLLLSAFMLAILIPGGPIETRNFSHISPVVLGMFNVFLTTLGLLSMLLIYFTLAGGRDAFAVSALLGASYFVVYALDLGNLFPVSSDPMPQALRVIEIFGMAVSLPLMAVSVRMMYAASHSGSQLILPGGLGKKRASVLILMFLIGSGIVMFATYSAMHK
jgi:hypothetical protein